MHARRQRVLTRIRQFFDRANVARLIVAFVLAFALWAWVTAQTDPEVSRTIPQVPVTAVNVAPGFRVGSDLQPVEVHLQGAQSRIQAMETGTVRAVVDLSEGGVLVAGRDFPSADQLRIEIELAELGRHEIEAEVVRRDGATDGADSLAVRFAEVASHGGREAIREFLRSRLRESRP